MMIKKWCIAAAVFFRRHRRRRHTGGDAGAGDGSPLRV